MSSWLALRSRFLVTLCLATTCVAGAAGQEAPVPAAPSSPRESVRPQVPGPHLPDRAPRGQAAGDRRAPRRRGVEAGRVGRRLHAADPDRGRQALASRPSSRSSTTTGTSTWPSARTTTPRRSTATRAAATTSTTRRRRRRRLLRQLQRQAHGLRVRPHGGRQQDRPHPRERRDRVGHDLGRGLGRRGRPRREGLDGRVPGAAEPAAVRAAGRAGLGHARLALDRPQPGRGPVAAHPAAEHRTHVPARRAARDPGVAALRATSSCCRTSLGKAQLRPVRVRRRHGGSGAAGLDAKVGLTSNFTLDATVNPDFGQVEADPSVINLTAYETFYEEKRPFFLEGRKILTLRDRGRRTSCSTRDASARRPPTPRRSPRAKRRALPESTTILGAFKVTGKTNGGLSVGALQGFTQKETVEIASPLGDRDGGRGAVRQLHDRAPPQGLGQGQHEPRRDAHLDPPVGRPTPPSRSCPRRRPPAGSTSRATSRTAPGCSRRAAPSAGSRATRRRSGPADERGALLPAARREPPGRGPERARRSPATGARCASAAPTPAGCA